MTCPTENENWKYLQGVMDVIDTQGAWGQYPIREHRGIECWAGGVQKNRMQIGKLIELNNRTKYYDPR